MEEVEHPFADLIGFRVTQQCDGCNGRENSRDDSASIDDEIGQMIKD